MDELLYDISVQNRIAIVQSKDGQDVDASLFIETEGSGGTTYPVKVKTPASNTLLTLRDDGLLTFDNYISGKFDITAAQVDKIVVTNATGEVRTLDRDVFMEWVRGPLHTQEWERSYGAARDTFTIVGYDIAGIDKDRIAVLIEGVKAFDDDYSVSGQDVTLSYTSEGAVRIEVW